MHEPVLLVRWEALVGEILDRTARFPKSARFSFAARIDTLALDILAGLTQARWANAATRGVHLAQADSDLAVLRTLLRLAHACAYLDHRGFELLARGLDEAGRSGSAPVQVGPVSHGQVPIPSVHSPRVTS